MRELLLIRHTTPEVIEGTCYGQLDLDCNANFSSEADEIKRCIKTSEFIPGVVYSSPLKRCMQLARYLFPKQIVNQDDNLKELSFGTWEGSLWKEIPKNEIDAWADNFVRHSPPEGESFEQLLQRVENYEKQLEKLDEAKIAVVTHSGVIRAFLMKYLNIPATNIFNLNLNYGAVVKITIQSGDYHQVEFIKG